MKTSGEADIQSRILIAPTGVDFMDTTGHLYRHDLGSEIKLPDVEDYACISGLNAILDLKRNRDSSTTAVDINRPGEVDHLRPDRRDALTLAHLVAGKLAHDTGKEAILYGFADISSLPSSSSDRGVGDFRGHRLLVRTEEFLVGRAEQLIGQVETALAEGNDPQYALEDGRVRRITYQGEASYISLRGYTFNRAGSVEDGRQNFPNFPSCETFTAAAVLDQIAQAGTVVRIIPESAKAEEYAARTLLQITGHTHLPVISLVASEGGNIQTVIPWTNQSEDIDHIRTTTEAFRAHRTSNRVIAEIRDLAKQHQAAQYDELMASKKIPEEAKVNDKGEATNIGDIAPGELMQYPYLSARILEFLGRTLSLATIYEACKVNRDSIDTVADDIRTIIEAFSGIGNYNSHQQQPSTLDRQVRRFAEGYGSNDVLYTTAQLAVRPEVDPSTLRSSRNIQLLAHIVHEHVDDRFAAEVANVATQPAALLELLRHKPPRFVLVQAMRAQK